mmetsp:Transcript_1680/g.5510  ORF Transcript_1680/g.5510 Transcript_1680/m.5510 type:complete len:217 (-) Transcript_1680:275-925(-)
MSVDGLHRSPVGVRAGDAARLQEETDGWNLEVLASHQADARQRESIRQHVRGCAARLHVLQVLHHDRRAVEELGLRLREHHHLHKFALLLRCPLAQDAVDALLRVAAAVQVVDSARRHVLGVGEHKALPAQLRADCHQPAPLLGHATRKGHERLHVATGAARDHEDVALVGRRRLLRRRGRPAVGKAPSVKRDPELCGPVRHLRRKDRIAIPIMHD